MRHHSVRIPEGDETIGLTSRSAIWNCTGWLERFGLGAPGGWQAVALAVMTASTCLLTWIASRIFRTGLLTQGSRTTWGDVARWALRG
jgi:hypothetical protein